MIPLRGTLRGRAFPAVALLLVGANVLVFLQELALAPRGLERFLFVWGLVPAREAAARSLGAVVENALTSIFVHGGWAHLAWNMLYLWVFGSGLESRLGHARFAGIYFVSGVIAAEAQAWFTPLSVTPIIGASGAIAGILGAYFVVSPRARLTVLFPVWIIPFFFQVPAVVFLGLWFAQQFLSGFLSLAAAASGGIAWWAHVAGFLAGALLVKVVGVPPLEPPRIDPWARPYDVEREQHYDDERRWS